jgi:glycosyltransferase involved in cell wall biosynthesis
MRELPAITRILRTYDVLYSHTAIPGEIIGGLAARIARRPHVVHRHTPPHLSPTAPVRTVQTLLYRAVLRDSPVIAVSAHVRLSLLEMGMTGDRVEIVRNGAPSSIEPSPSPRSDKPRVGLLGRIDPQKGMDVFLEAARLLELREAEFVIGGIGGGFPGFEKSVRARANELNVAILETEGRGLEFLKSLDIVVMPSRWEGSPLTLFEAMALQKPIVATDIPGISEVLRGTGAGLLVRPDHADDLARAIARLIDDPGLAMALGSAARQASTLHSESRSVDESVAIILDALH